MEPFRESLRAWLDENAPASLRGTVSTPFQGHWGGTTSTFADDDTRAWFERCHARGWTAPTWPVEYGGGGLSSAEAKVLTEELKAQKLPQALVGFGLEMIGPTLLRYGTGQLSQPDDEPSTRESLLRVFKTISTEVKQKKRSGSRVAA